MVPLYLIGQMVVMGVKDKKISVGKAVVEIQIGSPAGLSRIVTMR